MKSPRRGQASLSTHPGGTAVGTTTLAEVPACARCGQPLTRRGVRGECLRCALRSVLGDDEADEQARLPAVRPPPCGQRYGHFEVRCGQDGLPVELGRGAMGVTYQATDTTLRSSVALKVIHRNVSAYPAVRARFLREARVAARLHHPNAASVFHFGEQNGECFYVMELVEGETLEARVRREGPLVPALALEIIAQVARALAAAESAGVVHRDLKPSNLMLTLQQGEVLRGQATPLVKVIDFGLGKLITADPPTNTAGGDLAETRGGFVGTPAFASPEQFAALSAVGNAGGQIDGRGDFYSLGLTLWYLLCGQTPFTGNTLEEVAEQRRRQTLAWEQLAARRVPKPMLALLRRLLAHDLAQRPQSARELLDLVGGCQQLLFPPVYTRRSRWLAAAALAVAVLVAAGTVFWRVAKLPALAALERSVAVLPFASLSADKDNAFFADGVQDEILTDLSKVADLKVISRTSVLPYKDAAKRNLREIGQELGVAFVLEGSVQRAGKQVRVNVQLIDARTDTHRWAQIYDRPLDDVFAIQSEIAKAIAGQLQAKLSATERQAVEKTPTSDVTAFGFYSQAKTILLTSDGKSSRALQTREAISLLNQALARDPKFLQAACELAGAHDLLYFLGYDHTPQRLALAEAALHTALRLDPQSGEAHLARAFYLYRSYDYDGALAELETVRRLLPNSSRALSLTGSIQRRRSQWDACVRSQEAARELDPRNFNLLKQVAITYVYLHRYQEVKELYSTMMTIQPDEVIREEAADVELDWKADPQPLRQVIASIREKNPAALADVADEWVTCSLAERDPVAARLALAALEDGFFADQPGGLSRTFGEGLVARMTNDPAKAREAFTAARVAQEAAVQAQPNYGPPLAVLALIDAGLGRKEEALREGRRAVELLPVSKDAIVGPQMIEYLAITAAWVGDKDLACEQLALATRLPSKVSYGKLKLMPYWDPLRGDPRFEAVVASLAPKP